MKRMSSLALEVTVRQDLVCRFGCYLEPVQPHKQLRRCPQRRLATGRAIASWSPDLRCGRLGACSSDGRHFARMSLGGRLSQLLVADHTSFIQELIQRRGDLRIIAM